MRITGGNLKGRTLRFPSRSASRPTTDFLREALFNLLEPQTDRSFLDLYAGSGAVGLEAASRGAKPVVFVEKSPKLIGVIRENVFLCGCSEQSRIIHNDAASALRALCEQSCRFDVVFADPPYCRGFIGEALKAMQSCPVMEKGGTLVLQHSMREPLPVLPGGWRVESRRKYGENLLTFIRMDGE
ncbi:MAG TPA: 16S rRNA (guanine(966)-N(2))-methyltransferase RsmD [Smithellaceae bacterium]|nr:16S rRNA (guanine(966)-N(2))-methyltransferase RsmD [Smithellaceae bacterium]HRV44930.1 16S rRNA (guanine(966)-N(2))-methyltransferase RsmD [Smithellaceae bacterium]